MTPEETLCLTKIKQPNKPKSTKMPHWTHPEQRPTPNSIIAWEIYGQAKSPYTEQDIIKALKSLTEQGILTMQINKFNQTIWFTLNEAQA